MSNTWDFNNIKVIDISFSINAIISISNPPPPPQHTHTFPCIAPGCILVGLYCLTCRAYNIKPCTLYDTVSRLARYIDHVTSIATGATYLSNWRTILLT